MESRFSLVCSIRRAMPYPCCGPIAFNVFSTIRAKVPCQTSAFALMLGSQRSMPHLIWESNRITPDSRSFAFIRGPSFGYNQTMSLVVVGSVAYDGVETPHGKIDR